MLQFVDPRSNPEPPAPVSREPAAHGEELRDLIRLCAAGRVYDIERWIQAGRPIQALNYRRPGRASVATPIRTAIRENHYDVVLLLLCNGYRVDLETRDWDSLLDLALGIRAFDILELLLKWGADPTRVRACNIIETYKSDLIDQFWRAGVDYTADPEFALALAHTVNKPLYGWLRRNRTDQRLQDALDSALVEAVAKDKAKSVSLLLWAGADPLRRVPSASDLGRSDAWDADMVSSGAEMAILYGRHELFGALKVAAMPDLEAQAARAHDSVTLKKLVALHHPADWSPIIIEFTRQICRPIWRSASWDAREALGFIAASGGRLTTVSADGIRWLRWELLNVREVEEFRWLLRWLKKGQHCEPAIYEELARTAAMREKIAAVDAGGGYLTPSQKMKRANDRRRRAAERQGKITGKSGPQ